MSNPQRKLDAVSSPFNLDNNDLYQRWRDQKLKGYPTGLGDLLVEINDPRKLTDSEFAALQQRCRKSNMALYASKTGTDPDPGRVLLRPSNSLRQHKPRCRARMMLLDNCKNSLICINPAC